MTETNSDA